MEEQQSSNAPCLGLQPTTPQTAGETTRLDASSLHMAGCLYKLMTRSVGFDIRSNIILGLQLEHASMEAEHGAHFCVSSQSKGKVAVCTLKHPITSTHAMNCMMMTQFMGPAAQHAYFCLFFCASWHSVVKMGKQRNQRIHRALSANVHYQCTVIDGQHKQKVPMRAGTDVEIVGSQTSRQQHHSLQLPTVASETFHTARKTAFVWVFYHTMTSIPCSKVPKEQLQ